MAFIEQHKKWIFIVFFVSLLVLTIIMLRSYLSALFVGALIAYFIYPLYTKLVTKVKYKLVAQAILSIGSVLILLGFLSALILPLISQTQILYQKSEQYLTFDEAKTCNNPDSLPCRAVQKMTQFIQTEEFQQKSKEFIQKTSVLFFQKIGSVISGIMSFILFIIIVVFSLFYFLDHGREIKNTFMEALPLKSAHKDALLNKLKQTITAVVGGNISTALLQGLAGGVIFFILGIPLALFWGLLMAVFAFIPAVGPAVIWLPAAVLLMIMGSGVKGIILIVYCVLVLGYIDNFLKPKLIGDKIKLSSFWIFLGVLGGLQMFGILGLFFGPIILALVITCLEIYREMSG